LPYSSGRAGLLAAAQGSPALVTARFRVAPGCPAPWKSQKAGLILLAAVRNNPVKSADLVKEPFPTNLINAAATYLVKLPSFAASIRPAEEKRALCFSS
jgi:hypothetical protein